MSARSRISAPRASLATALTLHLDCKVGHGPATPDDPDGGDVVLAAVEYDFVDKAPQQRLTLGIGGGWLGPDLRH